MIKNQDILVLATLMGSMGENLSYAKIADKAKLSVSESFAAVNRLIECDALNQTTQVQRLRPEGNEEPLAESGAVVVRVLTGGYWKRDNLNCHNDTCLNFTFR